MIISFPHKQTSGNAISLSEQVTIDLPVARRALARIRFAPTNNIPQAVLPIEALTLMQGMQNQGVDVQAVKLTGPGDPLGDFEATMETLILLKQHSPGVKVQLNTLGIFAEKHAKQLVDNGVSTVVLQVDAVDIPTAQKLYAWIRPGKKTVPLPQAAELLMGEQSKAVQAFQQAGCDLTISATVYPGINDSHVEYIAKTMAELGAERLQLSPFMPSQNHNGDQPEQPDHSTMKGLRKIAAQHIKTVTILNEEQTCSGCHCAANTSSGEAASLLLPKPSIDKPNVAVASSNGMEVDLHLGQTFQFLIYGPREDGLACLLESRQAPEPGGGDSRWGTLAESLDDCFAVLASGAGKKPHSILAEKGVSVLICDDDIEGTVDKLFGGKKKGKKRN